MKTGLNPYRQQANGGLKHSVTGEHASTSATRMNSKEPLFNRQGEINADDKRDAMRQIRSFYAQCAAGTFKTDWLSQSGLGNDRKSRHELLSAAYADSSGKHWNALGAALVEMLANQQLREGFVRNIATRIDLSNGEVPRIVSARSDAVAVVSSSVASVEFQEVRARTVFPREVSLTANLRVQTIDLQQASGDLLEKTYNEAVEAIMVAEDRLWKKAADDAVAYSGQRVLMGGGFTPALLGAVRSSQTATGFNARTMLLGLAAVDAMAGNSAFYDMYDPVTKYEMIQNGQLGSIFGTNLITDTYRMQHLRVLDENEVYVLAAPEVHAGYSDRGGVIATPVDGAQTSSASKGWFMEETFSVGIVDTRSVTKGIIRR